MANKTIAQLIDGTYHVVWTDEYTDEVIYEQLVAIAENDDIDLISEEIWDYFNNPVPRPSADPIDFMTLTEYKDICKENVNQYREEIINAGYHWNGHCYDSDERARANVTSVSTAIANGIVLPSNFSWRTRDNQNIPMNSQEVVAFGVAMMNWVSTVYAVSWFHKDNMDAIAADTSKTEQERKLILKNYNYTIGWPAA